PTGFFDACTFPSPVGLACGSTATTLSWDARFGKPERLLEQLHVMALVHIVRQLCPAGGKLAGATMINPAMGEEGAYRQSFGCAMRFDQPVTSISFPASAMHAPVDTSRSELCLPWRTRQRTLHTLPSASLFVGAVCQAILQTLPAGAPADLVAERLNLSRRTFQRRLTESNCSFRQLLDGVRERYARQLLQDESLSRKEVAFLLGYSEQSAFNHAVARWASANGGTAARQFGANYQDEIAAES
ncbi:MAG TPA: helix-turn-helix domain-containing protein, partial [Ottowia sp.]|nr:helix-turn-helix domain-containing protein [Ottowia sp.]HNO42874.1 helix-turn-helix domain-containing protein [Ottowia sp.]